MSIQVQKDIIELKKLLAEQQMVILELLSRIKRLEAKKK